MASLIELQEVYLEYSENLPPGSNGLSFPEFCNGYRNFALQPASASDSRKLPVDINQLKDYLACDFKIGGISVLMDISEPTLKRRMKEYGLSIRGSYSKISDDELDVVVANALKNFPKFGLQLLKGKLVADGYKLQEKRLRASYDRVGLKQAKPCLKQIPRVVYQSDSPLKTWHLDGFHKFDGWGFVVHGIVDGYSKAIVGMQVSDNNRSETVVKLLHSSCKIWGTPACLRTDRGGENVLAADYMLSVRGMNRFSFYAGSSMRNQRCERQWKDTNERGVRPLLFKFNEMENAGIIQVDSELDLFILHQVATNLFQRTLEAYVDSWNNHPIRTEGRKTPNQLYVSGLVLLKQRQDAGEFLQPRAELLQDDVLHLPENFNDTDYLESIVGPFRQAREVPKFTSPLNAQELADLAQLINPNLVELENLIPKFTIAKRFVIFALNNRVRS